jgi:hypothetical protein
VELLADLLVLALAVNGTVEVWRHSALTAERRAELELERDPLFFDRVLLCPWCLSVWTGWLLALLYFGCDLELPAEWPAAWHERLPLYLLQWGCHGTRTLIQGLAAARAANLLNDLTYASCRTPRDHRELELEPQPEKEPG